MQDPAMINFASPESDHTGVQDGSPLLVFDVSLDSFGSQLQQCHIPSCGVNHILALRCSLKDSGTIKGTQALLHKGHFHECT